MSRRSSAIVACLPLSACLLGERGFLGPRVDLAVDSAWKLTGKAVTTSSGAPARATTENCGVWYTRGR